MKPSEKPGGCSIGALGGAKADTNCTDNKLSWI